MLRTAIDTWRRFWFTPVAATNLGVSRFLFFLGLTAFYLPHDFSGWGDVSTALFQPIWLFERFGIPILNPGLLDVVQVTWKLALLCACIGLFTRPSLWVAAVLGTYLLGLGHNFGQTYHFDAILVLAFWILAFSRAGDAWSLDSLRRVARNPDMPPRRPSGEYQWPVQLVLVALAFVFFAAGVAKLRASGLAWILSDHLAILLDRVQYRISDADPLLPIGSFVARIPFAPQLMGLGTILFEAGYPIALFSPRLRPFIVLGGIGLIVGIRVLMGPTFENFLLINLFWVPWDRVGAWLRARATTRTEAYVLFDGACGLCVPAVAVLRRLDLFGRVSFLDVTRHWPEISRRFPSLTREHCLADMHVVTADGTFAGYDAYRALSKSLPIGWLLRPLLFVPPLPQIGRRLYRHVADRRSRHCEWQPATDPTPGAPVASTERVSHLS
jgi:predicted DCC family thiol-disulfide oxidoreductase YuxK